MTDREHEQSLKPAPGAVYWLAGATAVVLFVGSIAFVAPRPAGALPAYATQTKKSCGDCHTNPAGGGALTALGKAFAANGHKLPSEAKPGKTGEEKPGKTGEEKPGKTGDATTSAEPDEPNVPDTPGKPATPGESATPAAPATAMAPAIVLDYAQAQAWSLRHPYYSHFLYNACDYKDEDNTDCPK